MSVVKSRYRALHCEEQRQLWPEYGRIYCWNVWQTSFHCGTPVKKAGPPDDGAQPQKFTVIVDQAGESKLAAAE
ncbi:hypothetical protein Y032_0531g3025 [Ancylostoma ceylanicum]|uniref:Uncharacterized protein n=1 Tax=Ancylostoma ceylanicum TaxID=53326 RepID=A0A016WS16_9BILA|nr:hypothetical protein Y032_0531g3025 [Ancylostoma ceylanicum]